MHKKIVTVSTVHLSIAFMTQTMQDKQHIYKLSTNWPIISNFLKICSGTLLQVQLTCHRYAGLLVLQMLISFRLLWLHLAGRGIWHTGQGRGWTRARLCRYSCALRWARELRFRLLLADLLLLPLLLLFSHLLPLLSFTFDQRHSVFDSLGHGFVITFTNVARFYLYGGRGKKKNLNTTPPVTLKR